MPDASRDGSMDDGLKWLRKALPQVASLLAPALAPLLKQVFAPRAMVPFFFPSGLVDRARSGGGELRKISPAANVDVTIAHDLARVPATLLVLHPGGAGNPPAATVFIPKWKPSIVTAWSTTSITVQFDTAMTNGWVWIG